MTALPLPSIPWQVTGNHWIALPCIHPADGALHAVGLLHRGARAAVEFAGHEEFLTGTGPALARPVLTVDGVTRELADEGIAWERALGWLPTFTCTVGQLVVRGSVFAPHGRDADMAGAVYAIALENRGATPIVASVALEGTLGWRQQRVRTPRPFDDAHVVTRAASGVVLLEGAHRPGLAALAIGAEGDAEVETHDGTTPGYSVKRTVTVEPSARVDVAFYLAAGPERDGAEATVGVMRRRGWRALLEVTRDAIQALEQSTGSESADRLVNRNLLFAYFYAVGRALDDAHFYMVRTRVPWHSLGVTLRDWEALAWTLPAIQLADSGLARELLLRMCELHGYAPGRGTHYLDGTLFEPGFSLEGCAAYAVATDRYIRDTGEDEIVEDPVVADTLYLVHDDLMARRDKRAALFSTEVGPSGQPVTHPFTLHGNAVTALALDVLRRLLDEETARAVEDPDAVRAAIQRHLVNTPGPKATFLASTNLAGAWSAADDPSASALWLPFFEAVDRTDSTYRRTVRSTGDAPTLLVHECGRLLGPDGEQVLQWLRRAPLDRGVAAEVVDAEGRAVADGGDASLSGLLAYTVWYAVHALGVRS